MSARALVRAVAEMILGVVFVLAFGSAVTVAGIVVGG